MALNIKNAETEKLVRELARRRGQGITEALTDVVRREVERERRKPRRRKTTMTSIAVSRRLFRR